MTVPHPLLGTPQRRSPVNALLSPNLSDGKARTAPSAQILSFSLCLAAELRE
jgi:hypothetical protein